jgi:UbiD family decarboxylase
MSYYRDLREHIIALEEGGKLARITRQVNKDTELMPLVRWQFRGLAESERKAFFFENIVDAKGRKYDIPVLVASHAASREVYAIALKCRPAEIADKVAQGRRKPIEPALVHAGPAQEVVHKGAALLEHAGLGEFPVPISTPGFDNAPYLTAANWISKDPDTGIRNVGNYRGMIKSPSRAGIMCEPPQDLRTHWEKCRRKGIPLQVGIAIGAVPVVGLVATLKYPYGVDELAVAGGIIGEPLPLLKCQTVDLEVPATAEIVIEGEMPTDSMERDAPFGEMTGYMGSVMTGPYLNVTCITHRRNPIYNAFISQFPPSESSKLRQVGNEANLLNFLKNQCGLPVIEVALPESCGSKPFCIVSLKKTHPSQAWQALNGVVTLTPGNKFIIAVDDDIDPKDPDAVNWAMSYRVQPERDIRIIDGMVATLDFSVAPPDQEHEAYPLPSGTSAVLINATTKWNYPPTSLPKKEFMENARQIWQEIGLPELHPKSPWFGYNLGYWTVEYDEEAALAVKGEHYQTGEKLERQRKQA